jgi:hypothetical protein
VLFRLTQEEYAHLKKESLEAKTSSVSSYIRMLALGQISTNVMVEINDKLTRVLKALEGEENEPSPTNP